MKYLYLLALGMLSANMACGFLKGRSFQGPQSDFLVIGHRGDAAHFPENSLEGFLSAVEKGVDALEMDVVVSGDRQIVVSHEPYMDARYVLSPQGKPLPREDQPTYNLYQMSYDSIRAFDSGSKYNPRFPAQKKVETYKPLLLEVIEEVELYTKSRDLSPVTYMIEVKSTPENYGTFQPDPAEFALLLLETVKGLNARNRIVVKSFDPAFLNALHELAPDITISYLVSKRGIKKNLNRLDFTPAFYSPQFRLIKNRKMVDTLHKMDMRVLPWTVNRKRSFRKMLRFGVDGIITDDPEKLLKIIQ